MQTQAKSIATGIVAAPIHAVGEVVGSAPEGYTVRADCGVVRTRRAASCLLEPERGDAVLISGQSVDAAFIIAVLERAREGPARLTFNGDAHISVAGGSMYLTAAGGVNISTPAEVAVSSDGLTLRSKQATVLIQRLRAVGGELSASIGRIKLIGNVLESVVERLTQSAKHSLRTVQGMDQVRSGVIDYRADQVMSLRGTNVVATARELVKLDGQQIHLG
jgi:hypothetical protein